MTPADIARTLGRSIADILDDEDEICHVYFENKLTARDADGASADRPPEVRLHELRPYSRTLNLKDTIFTKERMESTPWYKVYRSFLLESLLPLIEERYGRIPSDPEGPTSFGHSTSKRIRATVHLEILAQLPNATGVPSALTTLDTLLSEVDAVAKAKAQIRGERPRERAMTIYPELAFAGEGGRRLGSSGSRSAVYRPATIKAHAVFVGPCGGIMIFTRQDQELPAAELYTFREYVERCADFLLLDKPSGKDGKNILGREPEDLVWD